MMSKINWKQLKEDYDTYTKEYCNWLHNEANLYNCTKCPYNCEIGDGHKNWQNCAGYVVGPCQQQHCWVTACTHPERLR